MCESSRLNRLTPIGDLELGTRAYLGLYRNGFRTLDDLLQFSEDDYFKFCWMGEYQLSSIRATVAAAGYELPEVSADWVREAMATFSWVYHGIRRGLQERNSGTDRSP